MHETTTFTPSRFRQSLRRGRLGATIAEALVGTAIAATGLTGLCVAGADCIGICRAHREVLVANQCLQQRAEQFVSSNWLQKTDAASLQALLTQPSVNDQSLDHQTETITVNPYPLVNPPVTPIVVTRDATGTVAVVSQPAGVSLRSFLAIRIDFQETWVSAQSHRTRTRETSTVVLAGGLLQ